MAGARVVQAPQGFGTDGKFAAVDEEQTAIPRAWCRSWVDAGDWRPRLPAFAKAEIVVGQGHRARRALDGAAMAAQHLRSKDDAHGSTGVAERPACCAFRRWLGRATSIGDLGKRVAERSRACPKKDVANARINVLEGDVKAARLPPRPPRLGVVPFESCHSCSAVSRPFWADLLNLSAPTPCLARGHTN